MAVADGAFSIELVFDIEVDFGLLRKDSSFLDGSVAPSVHLPSESV